MLKTAMNPGDWFLNRAGRLPRLRGAVADAGRSGLPSIQQLLSRAKVVLSLEEGEGASSAVLPMTRRSKTDSVTMRSQRGGRRSRLARSRLARSRLARSSLRTRRSWLRRRGSCGGRINARRTFGRRRCVGRRSSSWGGSGPFTEDKSDTWQDYACPMLRVLRTGSLAKPLARHQSTQRCTYLQNAGIFPWTCRASGKRVLQGWMARRNMWRCLSLPLQARTLIGARSWVPPALSAPTGVLVHRCSVLLQLFEVASRSPVSP